MTQHLTAADAIAAARQFYEARKLTAQHPDPHFRQCLYAGADDTRCAIGAGLSEETLGKSIEGFSVMSLVEEGKLTTDNVERLVALQRLHDDWCDDPGLVTKFRKMIGVDA